VPRVGALSRLAGGVRTKPWLAVAIVAGALLVAAWLAWAIYVATDKGTNEGLGVLIAVPALVVAALIIALPFVGGYLLIRYLAGDSSSEEEGSSSKEDTSPEPEEAQATETS
jgi:ABC-type sulfate transport system permease subunit